jgi:preprotein translocase subunit SecF
MGDLIFVLPIFIIFFVILFQIFLLFKKGIDFIGKRFDLTIEQADEEEKINTGKMNPDYDQDEAKKRVAAAERKTAAESKERILNQNSESEAEIEKAKRKNKEKIKRYNSKQRKKGNKNSSLGEIFAQYNEVEKAVIYNEILSKPKALKRDQN